MKSVCAINVSNLIWKVDVFIVSCNIPQKSDSEYTIVIQAFVLKPNQPIWLKSDYAHMS